MRDDAEALVARLAKDEALAATGERRPMLLRRAADLYEATAERFGGSYSRINAATLRLLAGDTAQARHLARQVLDLISSDGTTESGADYWRQATLAEASLILGDVSAVRLALSRATAIAGDDLATVAVTRRQVRLVCDAIPIDVAVLEDLTPPSIVHYCGHRIDPDWHCCVSG